MSDQRDGTPEGWYDFMNVSPTQPHNTDKDSSSDDTSGSGNTSNSSTSTPDRQGMADAHIAQGALHNPAELPRVDGRWHWPEDADPRRAQVLGYRDPIDATLARSRNEIGLGVDANTPNVIFIPNSAHLNPVQQPQGAGFWSYLTVANEGSARELAWVQLGGQEAYGFEDVRYPTALQVWNLRQRMIAEGRDLGVFNGIDLTWVTGVTRPNNSTNPNRRKSNARGVIDTERFDSEPPHHPHDPTNGGQHDQTGSNDLHRYRTIQINGTLHTCDLSPAVVNRRELHKCEIPNEKGWKTYRHADTMDWANRDHLTKLNAWRDQAFNRGNWPSKRDQKRDEYTENQRRYAFDVVSENKGKPPGQDALKQLADDFNLRYGAKRTPSAMSALCARLSKMFAANGGKFVQGPKRGQAKKEEAERKRKEREDSDESKSLPKRRRKTEDGDEDVEMVEIGAREPGDEAREGEGDRQGPGDGQGEGGERRKSDEDAEGEEDEWDCGVGPQKRG